MCSQPEQVRDYWATEHDGTWEVEDFITIHFICIALPYMNFHLRKKRHWDVIKKRRTHVRICIKTHRKNTYFPTRPYVKSMRRSMGVRSLVCFASFLFSVVDFLLCKMWSRSLVMSVLSFVEFRWFLIEIFGLLYVNSGKSIKFALT